MSSGRKTILKLAVLASVVMLSGCARLEFSNTDHGDGMPFYVPQPYLLVTYNADCSSTGTVISVPDLADKRYVTPHSGYGANNLTVSFSNGVITSFGQQTDTQVPETLTALGSLATAAIPHAALGGPAGPPPGPAPCTAPPKARLYRIDGDGRFTPVALP